MKIKSLSKITTKVRQVLYDRLLGDKNLPTSTPNLYKFFLQQIDYNSKILDVGVGTGIYFENEDCIKLIKEKNIKIYGIDLLEEDINLSKERILKNNLESNVDVNFKNLLEIDNLNDFDIILFCESYSVINENLITLMLEYIIKSKKFNKKICLLNNIEDNPSFLQKNIKPYLKYIIWGTDFGRVISKSNIYNAFKIFDINSDKITFKLIASSTISQMLFSDKFKIPLIDVNMKQYLISIDCS